MPPTRNPFNLLAYLLFRVRRGLEDIEQAGQPPRWLRMARLGPQVTAPNPPVMANGVASVVKAFTTSLNWMAEATLDLRELLITTDAAKATAEAALRLLRTANSPEFVNGLKNILPASAVAELQSIAQSVDGVLGDIENILTYIPEPDDVNRMSHELYRLLCVVQRQVPYGADGVTFDLTEIRPDTQDHVDVANTGKIRLINWALDAKTTTRGLGDNEDLSQDLYRLGVRRLWETTEANLPQRSIGQFTFGARTETIFNFDFDHTITQAPAAKPHQDTRQDIVELWDLLDKHGYRDDAVPQGSADRAPGTAKYTAALTALVRKFQVLNGLPVTGWPDNDTINRLLHLDYGAKTLTRAIPYIPAMDPAPLVGGNTSNKAPDPFDDKVKGGFLPLLNADADHPNEEQDSNTEPLEFIRDQPGYRYLPVASTTRQGWRTVDDALSAPGFVAIQSRRIDSANTQEMISFEGDILTEGEASSGDMFWAARHLTPWAAGRTNTTAPLAAPALHNGAAVPAGRRIRMVQWIDLSKLQTHLASLGAGYELWLQAFVLRRSLYRDRAGMFNMPDQGRISLELYDEDLFKGPDPYSAVRPLGGPPKLSMYALSDWLPAQDGNTNTLTIDQVRPWWTWWLQSSRAIRLLPTVGGYAENPNTQPDPAKNAKKVNAALIVLEAQPQSGVDVDAYFDNVRVRWDVRKVGN
ncbi:peptidoglycan-binding protein [Myxococcota bacterium]|nr:peptidoglycan-binding protein [Myxococcota bacterium]